MDELNERIENVEDRILLLLQKLHELEEKIDNKNDDSKRLTLEKK